MEFLEWKLHPVTKEIFAQLLERTNDMKEGLALSAGIDSVEDARKSGYISAVYDMIKADYEGTE